MAAHPNSAQIAAGFATLLTAARAWEGTIYRFVTVPYANRHNLLSGAGSRLHGGRWNPAGKFNVVYGSLTPATAIVESLGTFSAFGVPPEKARPRVFAAIRLWIQSVLDLRNAQTLAAFGLTANEIAQDDWQAIQDQGQESLT
ncbi:MAG: RES domain-containing protein [Planctomycetes bacterium]|nr:RES domain-containing protein [Planctomycetota bacterium]